VLRFPIVAGAALSGTLKSKTGLAATLLLHVFRREDDGSYRRLEEKTTGTEKGAYRIEGLARGPYQISTSEDRQPRARQAAVGGWTSGCGSSHSARGRLRTGRTMARGGGHATTLFAGDGSRRGTSCGDASARGRLASRHPAPARSAGGQARARDDRGGLGP